VDSNQSLHVSDALSAGKTQSLHILDGIASCKKHIPNLSMALMALETPLSHSMDTGDHHHTQ
jgi:hypothetical protein